MKSKRTRKRYNKNSKIIIIMVLMVGVIGLSIGFSAFSKNLDINSTATVTPDPSDFKVLFSSSSWTVATDPIGTGYIRGNATGTTATIDNSNPAHPTISNLKATFTGPDQTVEWRFFVTNQGKYTAYLKKIEFGSKKCTAKEGTSQELVDKACASIVLQIYYDGVPGNSWGINALADTKDNITDHPLEKGASKQIAIAIYYYINAFVADGDFDVEFGDITLTYSTTDS